MMQEKNGPNSPPKGNRRPPAVEGPLRVGLAADHGGVALKTRLADRLAALGHSVRDFGAAQIVPQDDYPDRVAPMARAVAQGTLDRGIAVCGSGVGACIAANKIPGVRASLIHDAFSAHQGVEHDDMNVICLGGHVVGEALAEELVGVFLSARFDGARRHRRRIGKIDELENGKETSHGD